MLAIDVEFLHGTYRADPDGSAMTGRAEVGEWPPSAARLLAAFVAADGMGSDCRVTDGTELEFLEGLGPPTIRADASPHHQRLNERYVVRADKTASKGHTHQEYPARKGVEVRPGARVALRSPLVTFLWPDADAARHFRPLQLRAARIGYLGCADSPVRVRVAASHEQNCVDGRHEYQPSVQGTCMVSVPRPGQHLAALSAAHEAWLEHGTSVSRSWFPGLRNLVAYAGPDDPTEAGASGAVVAWLHLQPSVSGRRISDVTATLREAVMSRYNRLFGDPLPRELHGHGFDSRGFDIARYLALPNVGFQHSDGRIHGAAVWLPPDCDDTTRGQVRTAARSLDELHGRNFQARVTPWQGSGPTAANPGRWLRQSTAWVTAVPAIHERYGRLDLSEIARWCRHAGLPEPVAYRSTRVPLATGGLRLQAPEVRRHGQDRAERTRPFSHIELRFAEPVRGPVVIGAGRSRGFGLCIPLDDKASAAAHARRTEAS